MKKLSKASKYLRQAVKESEYFRVQNSQIMNENIKLNKTLQKICFKYLDLVDSKNDEVRNLNLGIVRYQMSNWNFQICKLNHQIEKLEQHLTR
jgi:hypothetical protein